MPVFEKKISECDQPFSIVIFFLDGKSRMPSAVARKEEGRDQMRSDSSRKTEGECTSDSIVMHSVVQAKCFVT